MSVLKYKDALLHAILGLLWRQWSGLGVLGYESLQRHDTFVDPEALLVASAGFARYDQRLYDLVASWLLRYGRLVNPTRLKALLNKAPQADEASLSYLAALCFKAGDKRWGRLAERMHGKAHDKPIPLFYQQDGTPLSYCPEEDAVALNCGFTRNTFIPQRKYRQNLPVTNATLLLRCRSLFGVSSRADVILQLLFTPCSIPQLVDLSGFARSSVKEVLDELEIAHAVSSVGTGMRNAAYVLANAAELKQMLQVEPPCHPVHWFNIYNAIGLIWGFVSNPVLSKLSEDTVRGEMKILFKKDIQPRLFHCGIPECQHLSSEALSNLPALLSTI